MILIQKYLLHPQQVFFRVKIHNIAPYRGVGSEM